MSDVFTSRSAEPKVQSVNMFFFRLISERGLPALRTLFDDVHFKGKGHEVRAASGPVDKEAGRLDSRGFRQPTSQLSGVFFVPPGRGPAAADAEDGELGPPAVPQAAV